MAMPEVAPAQRASLAPAERVQADLIGSLYDLVPRTVVGVLLGAAVVAWFMWNEVSHTALRIWLALNLAYAASRVAIYRRYRDQPATPRRLARWTSYWVGGALALGLIWGGAGVFMLRPDSPEQQSLLVACLIAIAAASLPLEVRHLPALLAFVVPVLVPISLHLLWLGSTAQVFLAGVSLLVLYGLLQFGRDLNASMREAIERRYENLDLIAALETQKSVLERAHAEAEAANRSKTRFLAAASHDLRQPLHALSLFASALQPHLHSPDGRKLACRIRDSVTALETQFNAILDLSKLDAGVVPSEPTAFPLESVFAPIRAEFAAEAAERGIGLRVQTTGAWLCADPVLTERVLRNLVSNAVRYTPHGKVLVGCRRVPGGIRIEVWDTGVGISPAHLPRIWEEFYQVGNAERNRRGGFGLGLATVKRLERLLGTRVTVRSTPGRGSVFSFVLPRIEPAAVRTLSEPATAPREGLAGRLVVVIDDEADVRDATRELLSQWGCDVVDVADVSAAFDRLGDIGRYPDAIIADLQLAAEASGLDAVAALRRELDMEIPALIVTGTSAPEFLASLGAAGLPVLHKPFSAEMLGSHLRQMLGGATASQPLP